MRGLRAQLPAMRARIDAGEGDKVPHPTTWLRNDRWLPEFEAGVGSNGHAGTKPLVSEALLAGLTPRRVG